MSNTYLVLAYWLLWIIFMFYGLAIQRRQGRIEKELEELKKALDARDGRGSGNP